MEHLVVHYLSQVSQTHGPTMQFIQSSHWIVPTEWRLLWFKMPCVTGLKAQKCLLFLDGNMLNKPEKITTKEHSKFDN